MKRQFGFGVMSPERRTCAAIDCMEAAMAVSGIFVTASAAVSAQQTLQPQSPHKHGHHRTGSITDVDAQSSSIATAPGSTGKIGSKVDITV
jgi:hypothetical protein